METFFALLVLYAGNSSVPGEFPAQRSVTRGFDIFFDPCLNKRLSKQSWGWWFETLSCPLWRHCNVYLRQLDICCDDMDLWTFLGNFFTLIGEEDSVSSAGHINSPILISRTRESENMGTGKHRIRGHGDWWIYFLGARLEKCPGNKDSGAWGNRE